MPASKALETSLVCTCLARFALPGGINDDFICDKVEKKSPFLEVCFEKKSHRSVATFAADSLLKSLAKLHYCPIYF
jgi:hypothetical protein